MFRKRKNSKNAKAAEEAKAAEDAKAKAASKSKDSKSEPSAGDAAAKPKGRVGRNKRHMAFRKNRGRLRLDITIQRNAAQFMLMIHIIEGRDLIEMKNGTANPQMKVYLSYDPKKTLQKSPVKKNTLNPMFNEQLTFDIPVDVNLESLKLHIVIQEHNKLRKSTFMGSMAFSLGEIVEDGGQRKGWYRLLDQQKGAFQAVPFRPGVKEEEAGEQKDKDVKKKDKKKEKSSSSKALSRKASKSIGDFGRIDLDAFAMLKVLGQGSYGKVLLSEHKQSTELFAIKVLNKDSVVEDDDVECTMIERRVLALANGSPFLTSVVASFQTPERLFFVMEFVNGGDLMFHVQKEERFPMSRAVFYAAEICLGLWFLHKNGVLYRDLKLDNVMLDKDGHVKIADFGMCKENIWGAATTTTFCGTPGYLAPEIIKEEPYGSSVDFWALGVLVYEMLVGDSPFMADDEDELFEMIQNHQPEFPPYMDDAAKDFISGLLTRNVKKRLGCGRNGERDIKSHRFFAEIDWDRLHNKEIDPPFKPEIADPRDVSNFDEAFTDEEVKLTPPDPYTIANLDQTVFGGFSYVNERYFLGDEAGAEDEEVQERRPEMLDYDWYRPDLTREEAARALRGTEVGTFFLRESASQPGCYAVAMLSEGNRVWNGLVTPTVTEDGRTLYKLFLKKKFESLVELVEYYYDHTVVTGPSGNKLTLRRPE